MRKVILSTLLMAGLAMTAQAGDQSTGTVNLLEFLAESETHLWHLSHIEQFNGNWQAYEAPKSNSQFYELIATSETSRIKRPEYELWENWVKYRKVYYPIEWTDCIRLKDSETYDKYEAGKCALEVVYFKDGRVAWRKK